MTRLCHCPSLQENFTFHLLHLYLAFFICSCSQVYQIPWADFVWADFAMCRMFLAFYLVYLSSLTPFSLFYYYKNKIFVNICICDGPRCPGT